MNQISKLVLIILFLLIMSITLFAEEIRPYILGSISKGSVDEQVEKVSQILNDNNFEIVGKYNVNDNTIILIFTNEEIKLNAANSEFGGYGALLRISVTNVNEEIQIAYTNPKYITNVYRMNDNLDSVSDKLIAIIGNEKKFGSKKGISAEKLRKYHYKAMMPYFDDQTVLAEYKSHEDAMEAINAGFNKNSTLVEKIYEVNIPGKDEIVFGVAIKEGSGADQRILDNCDKEELKQTCYLPYEILLSGNTVYAMEGKYRIAISFPDLSMGTFMKISTAPGAITKALKKVAKNE